MFGFEAGDVRGRAGFSLLELVVALLVLAFGVLGMATTTLLVTRELTLAEVTTVRTAAIQSVTERIRATPFDSIDTGADTIGPVVVSWSSTSTSSQAKTVSIEVVGPGLIRGEGQQGLMLSDGVTDTIPYTVLRP